MARRGRFSRQGLTTSPRHRPAWSGGPEGLLALSGSGNSIFAIGAQSLLDEVTIIRTRGIFNVQLNTFAGINEGFVGAAGICVVSENAFAAGVGSIPTPVTDEAWDGWLWFQFFSIKAITATVADGSNAVAIQEKFVIDSKAMRRTHITDVEVVVIEVTEVGTAVMAAQLVTRSLSKVMT